jgi:chemotaxis signal transduction protein
MPMTEAPNAASEHTMPLRLVCFRVRDQELGLPITVVRETIRIRPMTRVFLTPSWLVGIFSLRGEIVPAIDLAPWLGLPHTVVGEESRLVVLRLQTKVVGILADEMAELRVLDPALITPPPPTLSAEQAAPLSGVAATPTGTVRIIHPEALLRSDRMRTLEGASPIRAPP